MRVFITAGASGIGRAMAECFMEQGAQVAICDSDADAVQEFAQAHPTALTFVADVCDEARVQEVFAATLESFGSLDVVAANAGIGGPAGAVEDIDLAEWRACISVNLDGAFLTAKQAARHFKQQGAGLLLFTSSTSGLFGSPHRSPYSAAKWALAGLTKTLAMELGPHGVRVNAIAPGAVEGPRMDRMVALEAKSRGVSEDDIRDLYVRGVSLKTWVTAQDVANMASFLASSAGNKISGQILAVDGHTETLDP